MMEHISLKLIIFLIPCRIGMELGHFALSILIASTFAFPVVLMHAGKVSWSGLCHITLASLCIYAMVIIYTYLPSGSQEEL
jgi:hypothetical protein